MSFLKKAFSSRIFYLVLICITVAVIAAVVLFSLAFVNVEEKVPADPAPFKLQSGIADVINDFTFSVTLSYHGVPREIEVSKYTVEQLLKKENIVLEEQDVINVDLQSELVCDMLIQIDKVRFETEYEEVVLPFEQVEEETDDLFVGDSAVVTHGQNGLRQDTYSVKFVNDILVERTLTSQEITKEPVDEVITFGTKLFPEPIAETESGEKDLGETEGGNSGGVFVAPDGTEYEYLYYVDVTATAYGDNVGSITATGRPVEFGIIAVDPKVIPLHSKVYVIGEYGDYGVCDAQDVGGGIKGNRIDIYLKYEDVCRQFGVRKMRAYVLDVPD